MCRRLSCTSICSSGRVRAIGCFALVAAAAGAADVTEPPFSYYVAAAQPTMALRFEDCIAEVYRAGTASVQVG